MKKYTYILLTFAFIIFLAIAFKFFFSGISPDIAKTQTNFKMEAKIEDQKPGVIIWLPEPVKDGSISLEKAMTLRRSVRSYSDAPMDIFEVSQILWAAQGITNERGFRTAPSAGATFPLETYLLVNNVSNLKKGLFHYSPKDNSIRMLRDEDLSSELMKACLSQSMIKDGGIVVIFSAIFERTTARYGDRGIRYVHNEIGHASQNVHLQAAALDLGTVVIGAYRDEEVEAILNLGEDIKVLYLMPVGKLLNN
jgi:SagB-type dehydrogenase family enzyme